MIAALEHHHFSYICQAKSYMPIIKIVSLVSPGEKWSNTLTQALRIHHSDSMS